MHSLTLLRVKFNEPVSFPFLEAIKVFLQHVSASSELIRQYNTQSSAKSRVTDSGDMYFGRSLMYRRNNNGLRTLPCGTPDSTGAEVDDDPSSSTCWLRPSRKLLIHLFRLFCIPLYLLFESSRRCRTLSKALEKSKRITSVCPITSMVLARSCTVSRSCVSHDLLFRIRVEHLSGENNGPYASLLCC